MIFFTSDTHFGHTNIIKYCNRPFKTIEEMDFILIDNWNKKIKENDIVYFLGDFSFKSQKYRNELNGIIIPIKGNHDKEKYPFYSILKYRNKKILLIHFIKEQHNINIENIDYIFCGHIHEKWVYREITINNITKLMINVGVDVWNFQPISYEEIFKEIKEK